MVGQKPFYFQVYNRNEDGPWEGGVMRKQPFSRFGFLFLFLVFTFPVIPFLAGYFPPLGPLFAVDLFVRAVPLYLAWLADRAFLDAGELSPTLIPLWVLLTAMLLWPLAGMAARPQLLSVRRWRRIFAGYAVAALTLTCGASAWVFTHLGIFF